MAALYGRRLRRGAVSAAVAAAAVAAMSASQAPGVTDTPGGRQATGSAPSPDDGDSASGDDSYYTDLPPLNSPAKPGDDDDDPIGEGEAEAGIPATVLEAYKKAETALADAKPGCHLPWELLAAIGKVESGQARGGRVDAEGTTLKPILGPRLNGVGFANISDSDGGAYDGDTRYDRAVGPMQFIPQTWSTWKKDGNGDGKSDPNNIYDAALAAGHYLCAGDRDLSTTGGLRGAILSYNHSTDYLNTVLSWLEFYRKGTHEVPDGTGVLPEHNSGGNDPDPTPSPDDTGGPGSGDPSDPDESTPPTTPPSTTPPPTTPPTTPPPVISPTDRVARLVDAGTGKLSATQGTEFAASPTVEAESKGGAGIAKVRIKFEIIGDTDARFAGGYTSATVPTGADGKATAPPVLAGEETGDFTIRAKVVGRTLAGLDYTATVTARQADALARTGDKELTCVPGGEFADQVEVKATLDGAAAAGVEVTATMIKAADNADENDKGPYFKDADGKTIRTLKGLKTGADGILKLPKMYADDAAGTYLLRLNATGGGTVTIELKVAAAPAA
ncbi:lytic transglycosylase domain-containing protein [Streptomyces sp. T-3]|nr:lytic transglycosylase domain-containing protein [Streptomyces sp. T-3]